MFISKERIERELKDEDDWNALTPKEKRMFLLYCTNGFDGLKAYMEVYDPENRERVVKFPGSKAEAIIAKVEFENCLEIYGNLLKEMASTKVNNQIFLYWTSLAFYNIFDYIDTEGNFRYESIEEAKEILGEAKCAPILGITKTLHPKDASIEIHTVSLYPRDKALLQLQKFSSFFGEDVGGGNGFANINFNMGNGDFVLPTKEADEAKREKYGLNQ